MSHTHKRPSIWGTGLIALDFIMGAKPENPIRAWSGGTCANVLIIMSYLGWDAYPIARMNGDSASNRVRSDMERWGVALKYTGCEPTAPTPIVIQEIKRKKDGTPTHRFTWTCPNCGHWLPSYKAITKESVKNILNPLESADVFFMDRLSRAALTLAKKVSDIGGLVIYEPSCKSEPPKLLSEALEISHIIKYSNQRFSELDCVMQNSSATLLEIRTEGADGLVWRHRFSKRISDWKRLAAVSPVRLVDTCGSGDWCTAGLITQLGLGGLKGLKMAGVSEIERALKYGQTLSAWNCGFEGARGGMYSVSKALFQKQIKALTAGQPTKEIRESTDANVLPIRPMCPHCYAV